MKNFFMNNRVEVLSTILLIIGLILAFFYRHAGGFFVGLSIGFCFYDEMRGYFEQLRAFYEGSGVLKSVLVVGLAVYFLITIPLFVIATALGFAGMYFASRYNASS